MKKGLLLIVLLIGLSCPLYPQTSGPAYMRAAILGANRVQTVFGNWGVIGQPASYGSRGAWIYPSNGYIGDISILIGLELPIRDYNGDGIPDTVHSVITCPVSRPTQMADQDPATGESWTFEPDSGYFNPVQSWPAIRSAPTTWPAVWADHPEWGAGTWNGLTGPDSFSGDDETYFRMDDRNDKRFNSVNNNARGIAFHPDSVNLARTGQGISVGVRYIESASLLFQDILFRVYDITNNGTTDYSRVVFGTLTGTYVGVTSTEDYAEYLDDASVYFPREDFILTWNYPGSPSKNPRWVGQVGAFGEAFVETPAGTHIASCDAFTPPGQVSLGNDQDLWQRMLPGSYIHPASVVNDTVATSGEDMDYIYGSGYFPLKAGETRRVVALIAYGNQKEEIEQKIILGRMLWNSGFNVNAVMNSVSLKNFSSHRFMSGPQTIEWTTNVSGGTVSILYSPDAGEHWNPVLTGVPNSGSATWNTQNFPDAAFGRLRIFAYDAAGRPYGFNESSTFFTLDNAGNGNPFVGVSGSFSPGATPVTQPAISIPLLIGDPEWGSLSVTIFYRTGPAGTYVPCDSYITASAESLQTRTVSIADLPNSSYFQFKVVVSDGNLSSSDTTSAFDKETVRGAIPFSKLHFSGPAQVPVSVVIQDSAALRADMYIVTFNDTAVSGSKTFSVRDSTRHATVLSNLPISPGVETARFDGLSLNASDFVTSPDSGQTRWNRVLPGVMRTLNVGLTSLNIDPVFVEGYRQPYDYRIVFEDGVVDTTARFAPFEILGVYPTPVNYRVFNQKTNEKVKTVVYQDATFKQIFFLEDVGGAERTTWTVLATFNPSDASPHAGDTVYVVTHKGLSFHDTLTVFGITTSTPRGTGLPGSYALYQNYPNPFNPSTHIDYQLAAPSMVRLSIYDLLGREIAQVVNAIQPSGRHTALWRGESSKGLAVASGMYFCRLEARSLSGAGTQFTKTMKIMYLR